jgi:cell division ATPase FtsA
MGEILNLPIRIGQPSGVSGLIDEVSSTAYASSIGAVVYAAKSSGVDKPFIDKIKLPTQGVKNVWNKAIGFVKGFIP